MRAGQTEASVDLARIAGLVPAGVICEVMNDDGTMARTPDLKTFCLEHGLKLFTVADLIRYRMQHERYVKRIAESILPTRYGDFRMIAFSSEADSELHVALVRGDLEAAAAPLVRVHSHCLTGDVFGATSCDCRDIIEHSLAAIAREDRGVFVYLHHTGQGFQLDSAGGASEGGGLAAHSFPQSRRDRSGSEPPAPGAARKRDRRANFNRSGPAQNSSSHQPPRKVVALEGYGLEIADQVPLAISKPKVSHQTL